MKAVGNFVWFLFCGGLLMSMAWLIFGVLMAVTVIGIPFAYASFRIASFAAFPFGKELVDSRLLGETRILGTTLMNLIWLVFAGIWLAAGHIMMAAIAILSCLVIVPILLGAPAWAAAHLKLAGVSLAPLGKRVVGSSVAAEAQSRKIARDMDAKGL